jgi:transcriptional regulator with XRE-family HTH domain
MKKIRYPTAQDCKRRRERLGFSQLEIAQLCGVTQSAISKFERGAQVLNYELYFVILNSLGFSGEITARKVDDEIQL